MSSYVKLPHNDAIVRRFGPYPSMLNVGTGTTALQRNVGKRGLGRWEPGTQSTLLTLVELSAQTPVRMFDVGAHAGLHSAIVASVFGAHVQIDAFEPTPRTAAVARSIFAANQLPIRIERYAISDEEGTAQLYISPWDTSNSLLQGFRPAVESVTVPLITLDSYCEANDVWPSVMKIDVETLEAKVLGGALGMLARARTSFVCEVLTVTDRALTAGLMAQLDELDYHFHRWSLADGWIECSSQDVLNQVEHDGLDWLFTPDTLPARFPETLRTWRQAVAECTPDFTRTLPRDRTDRPRPRYGAVAARPSSLQGVLARVRSATSSR